MNTNTTRKHLPIFAAAGAALALTGTLVFVQPWQSADAAEYGPDTTTVAAVAETVAEDRVVVATASATPEVTAPAAESQASTPVNHQDAAARAAIAALAAQPGDVVSIDPETGTVWSVEIRTPDGGARELYINADTGEVVRNRTYQLAPEARTAPALTAVEAIDIVLAAQPNARIVEMDLGTHRGEIVWEILTSGNGLTEFYLNSTTGAIVRSEIAD